MLKAMIVTVGAQANQIIFSLSEKKPDYLALLHTDTPDSIKSVEAIDAAYHLSPVKCRAYSTPDAPNEIGSIVRNFYKAYSWLISDINIPVENILVDPTGGRKWMSSGAVMIASFLDLTMIYVDTPFKDGKPDPTSMKTVNIGNAFEQVGFLEEHRADGFFNEENYHAASELYARLFSGLKKPWQVEIKRLISDGMSLWQQFRFNAAYLKFEEAHKIIRQHDILKDIENTVMGYMDFLKVLKHCDRTDIKFFDKIKDLDFVNHAMINLLLQSEKCAKLKQYNIAVLILYRLLEFFSQYRLSTHNVDSDKISSEIRSSQKDKFKELTKKIYGSESEIPDKVALLHGMILLLCIEDSVVTELCGGKTEYLSHLRQQTEVRNKLWIEHGIATVNEEDYNKFKGFVNSWIVAHDKSLFKKLNTFPIIRF